MGDDSHKNNSNPFLQVSPAVISHAFCRNTLQIISWINFLTAPNKWYVHSSATNILLRERRWYPVTVSGAGRVRGVARHDLSSSPSPSTLRQYFPKFLEVFLGVLSWMDLWEFLVVDPLMVITMTMMTMLLRMINKNVSPLLVTERWGLFQLIAREQQERCRAYPKQAVCLGQIIFVG